MSKVLKDIQERYVEPVARPMVYVVVDPDSWDDFRAVMRSQGHEFDYSIEDSAQGGIEYHVHSHIEEAEDILWAIQILWEVETESDVSMGAKEVSGVTKLLIDVCIEHVVN